MKSMILAAFPLFLLVSFAPALWSSSENRAIDLKFQISKAGKVTLRDLSWLSDDLPISKYDGNLSTGSQVYTVILRGEDGKVLDEGQFKVGFKDVGDFHSDTSSESAELQEWRICFPPKKNMATVEISLGGKELFSTKLAPALAKKYFSFLQRKECFGLARLCQGISRSPYKAGEEDSFFQLLESESKNCERLKNEQAASCLAVQRAAHFYFEYVSNQKKPK